MLCGKPIYCRGLCRSCYEKDLRRRNPEFAERQRENTRSWLALPGNLDRKQASDRRVSLAVPRAVKRARHIKSQYGITVAEYDAFLAEPCGICRIKPSKHLDHCHRTGRTRGGLCHRCNIALGFIEGWFVEHEEAARAWMSRSDGGE